MQPITFQWKTRRLLLDGYCVEGLMPQRMEAFLLVDQSFLLPPPDDDHAGGISRRQ